MTTIKIAGVPEHFNLPWHLCLENRDFENIGIDLHWTDVPEGTGKLCQMLRNEETDVAVILTEGIVRDIVAGNPSKIVQIYVESPLLWGIHVAQHSRFKTISDLEQATVAISRLGSGSHLMAYIHAKQQGWDTNYLNFEIVNTIEGAVKSLTNGESDYFMWEHFMTKPLVDQQIFRRLGDCPTPWPCFVIAVRDEILQRSPTEIAQVLEVINAKSSQFKSIIDIDKLIASRYHLELDDVNEWLSLTEWSQQPLAGELLEQLQNQLLDLSLINKKGTFAEIVNTL
jgi:ABC-type nitrate/sulfonate/bicarbonate transport system substrate-binding protein